MTIYNAARMTQVINGVPIAMTYQISFAKDFNPAHSSAGVITALIKGASVAGVYDYTVASSGTIGGISLSLTCTADKNPNPMPFTCTIFSGSQCHDNPPQFIGPLNGVPPIAGPGSFAQGTFLLSFELPVA